MGSATLWERPPLNTISLKNGLLELQSRTLKPHSPEWLSPVQLSVVYDPRAQCPATEKFVREVYPPDTQDLAWQIRAWLMRPDMSIQKAILLLGEGSNGKSTELNAMIAFLGRENVSGVSLHRLESDKFASARLIGKLANVCPDLPSDHLAGTSIFKAITDGTGDTVSAEHKFRDSFDYRPFTRLILSANHPPRSSDATHAFFRRWLVLPFNRTFDESEAIPKPVMDKRLADPEELAGVFNKALTALDTIQERGGLTESESMKAAWAEFRATTDPLAVWLDTYSLTGTDLMVSKASLLAAFNDHATKRGTPAISSTAFGLALRRLRPSITDAQRTIGNRPKQWVWVGIGLSSQAFEDDSQPPSWSSRGSRGFPYFIPDDAREGGYVSTREQDRENPVNPVNSVLPF